MKPSVMRNAVAPALSASNCLPDPSHGEGHELKLVGQAVRQQRLGWDTATETLRAEPSVGLESFVFLS